MTIVRSVVAVLAAALMIGNAFGASIDLAQATSTGIDATVKPDSTEIGKPSNIWMGAVFDGALYLRSGTTWGPYLGGTLPIAIPGVTLSASTPISVVSGLDVSALPGLQLYLGYGAGQADMLSLPGHLKQIYPSGTPVNVTMTLKVTVPSNTPPGDTIVVRTINGELNEQDYPMTKDASGSGAWQASIAAPEGSILRYWYRRGDWSKGEIYPLRVVPFVQHNREALVRKNGTVSDTVAQWADLPLPSNSTGNLTGRVTDSRGNALMGIRVSAGPHQTMSRWDGTYRFLSISNGSTEITFRADNGEYLPTRTVATVTSSQTAVSDAVLTTSAMARVTFRVTVPPDTPTGAVPRLLGDTYRLGMFPLYETTGAESTRLIEMTKLDSRTWTYTAELGAGTCFYYAYTLGSMRQGAGRDTNGYVPSRSLCVKGDMSVDDTVATWKGPGQVPVTITVTSPTPDTLYVIGESSEPNRTLKMWPIGANQASYVFYTEPNTTMKYRYIRNGDKDLGVELIAPDQTPPLSRSVASGPNGSASTDTITAWRHQMREPALTTVQTGITGTVVPRTSGSFQTGVELPDFWRDSWRPLVSSTVTHMKSKNIKWVQIVSLWGILNADTPLVEMGWNGFIPEDLVGHIREVKAQGLNVALKAMVWASDSTAFDKLEAPHSLAWYDQYFAELKAAIMFHARIAEREGVGLLILPNRPWYEDLGRPGNNPASREHINRRWKSIVAEVRTVAPSVKLTSETIVESPEYDWFGDLDYVGTQWAWPLTTTDNATVSELYSAVLSILETRYLPIITRFQKSIIFTEVAYHSANTSARSNDVYGADSPEMSDSLPAVPVPPSDYDEQGRVYEALLLAFGATPWVQGCYSFGYNYFDLDSKAYSIRSKTAEEIVSQIYQQLNGL